jgi:hypothetical protein
MVELDRPTSERLAALTGRMEANEEMMEAEIRTGQESMETMI